MSNIPDYIKIGIGRINDFLPVPAVAKQLSPAIKGEIPFGMSGAYDFFETEIFGYSFLLAGIGENEDDLPPTVLAKQQDVLLKKTGLIPIFIFRKLTSYLFPRYAKKNINVVVADRQLFLPAIFLISEKGKAETPIVEAAPPAAFQLMVLFHLQKKSLDDMTMRDVAELLNLSYATINRCVRWMKENGFVKLSEGKEKRIEFAYHGKNLWDKALPFLGSPIDFIVYTPELAITDKGLISEQNALAEYSMLNGGPYRMAISRDVYKVLKKQNIYWDQYGEVGIEVWKYDPRLLSETDVVDKLSLYLILKDYEDERVQIELENMMNEIVW